MLACLAFVPVDYVVGAFVELQVFFLTELEDNFTYFENNYMDSKKKQKTSRFNLD